MPRLAAKTLRNSWKGWAIENGPGELRIIRKQHLDMLLNRSDLSKPGQGPLIHQMHPRFPQRQFRRDAKYAQHPNVRV